MVAISSVEKMKSMRKRRAILYDDDPLILDFFCDVFAGMGYEVIAVRKPVTCPLAENRAGACTGPCADLILTDYQIRGISGLSLLLAQNAKGCKIPIQNKAITSGSFDNEFLHTISEIECGFFQKPVLLSELYEWILACEHRSDLSHELISRRRHVRHAMTYKIQCLVNRTGQILDALAINMSDNGLCVRLASPLPEKETIRIQSKPPVIPCDSASVRWIRSDKNAYQAGLICH